MRLAGKIAVVHGAGGSVGGAVARVFAAEGAMVHMTARTTGSVTEAEGNIARDGGQAHAHQLDVTDADAVQRHTREILAAQGRIDILYNAVTYEEVQGTPLHLLEVEAVERTLRTATRAHLNTVGAVVPSMADQGSGVIQTMVGYGAPHPLMGSTALAWHVIEGIYRQFAVELGERGIRVQWFRTGGFRESILAAPDYGSSYAGEVTPEEELAELGTKTMLHGLPCVSDAGAFAAFAASLKVPRSPRPVSISPLERSPTETHLPARSPTLVAVSVRQIVEALSGQPSESGRQLNAERADGGDRYRWSADGVVTERLAARRFSPNRAQRRQTTAPDPR